jgi:uncharacterized membrane protein YfcA
MTLGHDILAGLLVGILVGMTGVGGGSLMAPILIYLFHFKAKVAVGSDLAYAAIAKVFGAWQHARYGTVDFRLAFQMAIGSVPSSLLGVWVLHKVDKHSSAVATSLVTHLLGFALILVAVTLIIRSVPALSRRLTLKAPEPDKPRSIAWPIGIGIVFGFLVGITSVGAGALFGAAMILVFGLGVKEVVGTDIFHAVILSGVAALGHVIIGDVDFRLVGGLLIGAIPGMLIGSRLSAKTPDFVLRPTLATVLLASGLRTLVS